MSLKSSTEIPRSLSRGWTTSTSSWSKSCLLLVQTQNKHTQKSKLKLNTRRRSSGYHGGVKRQQNVTIETIPRNWQPFSPISAKGKEDEKLKYPLLKFQPFFFLLSVKSYSHNLSNPPYFCLLKLIKIRPILSPYDMRSRPGPGMVQCIAFSI